MQRTLSVLLMGVFIGLALGWAIYTGGCSTQRSDKEVGVGVPKAPIVVYFSPSNGPEQAILQALRNSKNSVHVVLYQLTDPEISQVLIETFKRGVEVQILLDEDQGKGSKGCRLLSEGIPVKQYLDIGIMHHKFAVFDGERLITGSYNWTTAAQTRNEENLLVIESPELAAAFEHEFQKLWNDEKARLLDSCDSS